MSQTKQQEQGAVQAKPGARKDWEWFWRIIAGLMLIVIAWVAWVVYQIMPRSVVTPLAYSTQIRPIGKPVSEPGAQAPAVLTAPASMQPAAGVAVPDPAQAVVVEPRVERSKGEGLRLATEISTPLAEKPSTLNAGEAKPGGASAATGTAAKNRP